MLITLIYEALFNNRIKSYFVSNTGSNSANMATNDNTDIVYIESKKH